VVDHSLPLGACSSGIMVLKSSQKQRCVSAKKFGNTEMGQHWTSSTNKKKEKEEEEEEEAEEKKRRRRRRRTYFKRRSKRFLL